MIGGEGPWGGGEYLREGLGGVANLNYTTVFFYYLIDDQF